MIENIKKSFKILFVNSAIMMPIVLFVLFFLIFNAFMGMSVLSNPSMGLVFMFLSILLFSAFLSGWLYIIKFAVDNYKDFDKSDPEYAVKIGSYNIDTLKSFFTGVGEYFLPVMITVILSIIISNLLFYAGQKLFNVNNLEFLIKGMTAQSPQELPQINLRQLAFILYVYLITFVFHFITLFWLPELFYKTKNSLLSLFKSIGFLFGNFLISLGLYMFLIFCFSVFFVIAVITAFIPLLPLLMFFVILCLFSYSVILIFMTYKTVSEKKEIEKINSKDVFIKSGDNDNV